MQLKTFLVTGLMLAISSVSMMAIAEEFTVRQQGKSFHMEKLKVKTGDIVHFVNDDTVRHNIYSDSIPNHFELGVYKAGEVRSVKITNPGISEVGCLIHPNMKLIIEASPK